MHQVAIPSLHTCISNCTQNTTEANSVPDKEANTLPLASANSRAKTSPQFLQSACCFVGPKTSRMWQNSN